MTVASSSAWPSVCVCVCVGGEFSRGLHLLPIGSCGEWGAAPCRDARASHCGAFLVDEHRLQAHRRQ